MRRITSLTLVLSFVFLILTSVILFIAPEGRVAYWSDWHLIGFTKTQWSALHTNLGFLFLLAGLMHLWFNWRAVLAYLKNKARQMVVFTPAMTAALLITILFTAGTLALWPPFSSILDVGQYFKDQASDRYGEPPYGHAELSSLKLFAQRTGEDVDKMQQRLQNAGIRFKSVEESILEIAQANGLTAKELDAVARPQSKGSGSQSLPQLPPGGIGRVLVKDLYDRYGLDEGAMAQELSRQGIELDGEQSVKENAARLGQDPHSLYDRIYQAATATKTP